ncbi:MAG TPA: FAD-dependent oxidoreductase [Pirellulaceae bacterium]|nr:FAD-dependent oxidoreductase [Pirellulaceae bacterium]HMO91683.1 FAD-dependent oxidoreductase [Pirellulaceae bacterium]HMP68380.1 FAD-dependent oxidoreductase [Pirellulaceae bacterium]
MRIAIIGGGISGLTLAHFLYREYPKRLRAKPSRGSQSEPAHVTTDQQSGTVYLKVFEAEKYLGGHTRSIQVDDPSGPLNIDMGFIVFNQRTYPNFCEILKQLNVDSQPTKMSFSVHCEKTDLLYRGLDIDGLFAQRKNLLNPRFGKMLLDWLRFNKLAQRLLLEGWNELTVDEFFARHKFGSYFRDYYFYPMGSAVWSSPKSSFGKFPIFPILQFYRNHGLIGLDLPQWRVITGGSSRYVDKLRRSIEPFLSTDTRVHQVIPFNNHVRVVLESGMYEEFEHVVFATHSDQALELLGVNAPPLVKSVLSKFPYEPNVVTLHKDTRLLPKNRRAWACWNYFLPRSESAKATLTYNMNKLQNLRSETTYLVTLNRESEIDTNSILNSVVFSHPQFTADRVKAQSEHQHLIGLNGLSFCGAYWGNGFHEDGVKSALPVLDYLNEKLKHVQLRL